MVLNSKDTERDEMKSVSFSDPFTDMLPKFPLFHCYPFLTILPKMSHTVMDIDMCAFKIKLFLNYKSSTWKNNCFLPFLKKKSYLECIGKERGSKISPDSTDLGLLVLTYICLCLFMDSYRLVLLLKILGIVYRLWKETSDLKHLKLSSRPGCLLSIECLQ